MDKYIDWNNLSVNFLYNLENDEYIIEGIKEGKKIFVGIYEVLGYTINDKFIWSCDNPYIEKNLTETSKIIKSKIKENSLNEILKKSKKEIEKTNKKIIGITDEINKKRMNYIIINSYRQIYN
jgi:transcriptional regulator of heat shock response